MNISLQSSSSADDFKPPTKSIDWHAAVPSLVRAARRQMSPELLRYTTAEDVVQEAIVGVLASPRCRALPGQAMLAVIRRSLRRMSCQVHRSLHRQRRCARRELDGEAYPAATLAVDFGPLPEAQAEHAEVLAILRAGIRALPVADAEVLELLLEGLAPAELGTALGMRADSARKRSSRALDRLRGRLSIRACAWS